MLVIIILVLRTGVWDILYVNFLFHLIFFFRNFHSGASKWKLLVPKTMFQTFFPPLLFSAARNFSAFKFPPRYSANFGARDGR